MFDNKNLLLYPLSLIYGMATGLRNFLFNAGILKSEKFSIPVICVGNITMGGTGKTPHTEYLAALLSSNFNVAILSRGYKRSTSDFNLVVSSSSVQESGDEPLQMARKFPGVLVAVERNRVKGIRKILEIRPETEVIILDDGFQHRRLSPGLSVLLSDFSKPVTEDHLLPYGSLRESRNNIRRADIILITKTPENISPETRRAIKRTFEELPHQDLFFTSLKYGQPVPVYNYVPQNFNSEWNSFSDNGAVLVTGIANPARFEDHLKRTFSKIIHLSFRDHHNFTEEDMKKISKAWNQLKTPVRYVITTEKDAVRLRGIRGLEEEIKSALYYIPVEIEFLNNDKDEFDKIICDYVRRSK
jgi:tetraacyldisaccharide 4'-kinase